jgi:hypothetical protein
MSWRGQAGDHDLASCGRLVRRRGPRRTGLEQRSGRRGARVVDDQVVACGKQVAAHMAAHLAEADESDSHRTYLSAPNR